MKLMLEQSKEQYWLDYRANAHGRTSIFQYSLHFIVLLNTYIMLHLIWPDLLFTHFNSKIKNTPFSTAQRIALFCELFSVNKIIKSQWVACIWKLKQLNYNASQSKYVDCKYNDSICVHWMRTSSLINGFWATRHLLWSCMACCHFMIRSFPMNAKI